MFFVKKPKYNVLTYCRFWVKARHLSSVPNGSSMTLLDISCNQSQTRAGLQFVCVHFLLF